MLGFQSFLPSIVCLTHHQYSSSVSPFQANTGIPALAIAAAAWSCVENILQEDHLHSAPKSTKVSINTAAVQNADVVVQSSKKFGSQCIVVAIDAKKNGDKWEVFTHGGRNNTGIDALEFAKKMEESGAGELLVTSMDRDGTQVGYDIDLMSKISSIVNIPTIASGGVGDLDHLVDGIKLGNASAVLAASIFHYGKYSVKEAKEYLDSKGIPVRIWDAKYPWEPI